MIWYWLSLLGDLFVRLFAPLKPRDVGRINVNAKCPNCGHGEGKLRGVVLNLLAPGSKDKPAPTNFCQHTCKVCGVRWYEEPVVKIRPNQVWRSVARDEQEKSEDLYWAQHQGGAYIEVKQQDDKVN